jgi:DNA-binding transcriptional regulator YdaS (Cro superfamily)
MTKKNPLTFKEYLELYRTPIPVIAARCGLTFSQLYNLTRGGCPTLKTAIAIERYTEGLVTCKTLLPPKMLKEIEDNPYQK